MNEREKWISSVEALRRCRRELADARAEAEASWRAISREADQSHLLIEEAEEGRAAAERELADAQARNTRLEEFYEAWREVQGQTVSFELHNEAVDRLEAAEKALAEGAAGGETA